MNVKKVVKLAQRIEEAQAKLAALQEQLRDLATPGGGGQAKPRAKRKYTKRAKQAAPAAEKPARPRKAKSSGDGSGELAFPKPRRGRPPKAQPVEAPAVEA